MKNILKFSLVLGLILGLSGCGTKNRAYASYSIDPVVQETYNQAIVSLADQLYLNAKVKLTDKVAITTFVDLHKLNKTTHFGRKLSESMYNELYTRGFNLIDIRGTRTIRVNADGEFFITRDIKLLNNKRVENTYVLIGTYSKFGKGTLINVRMIDNLTGDVVTTARTILDVDDCDIYENCPKKTITHKKIYKRTIGISNAGCSKVSCPTNCVNKSCYKN